MRAVLLPVLAAGMVVALGSAGVRAEDQKLQTTAPSPNTQGAESAPAGNRSGAAPSGQQPDQGTQPKPNTQGAESAPASKELQKSH